MNITIFQVDAFTKTPFKGNPAAVCIRDESLEDDVMQSIASEMNLAETAFVTPENDGEWGLRWFTPLAEVDLCGHATLASAFALFETGRVARGEIIRFQTKSGELTVGQTGSSGLEMNFPAEPVDLPFDQELLENAIRNPILFGGANRMDAFAEVDSEETLQNLKPDMSAIAVLPVRGLIVTARASTSGLDFVSRFFAPQCGVPEDPVTGSAHCCLGPYWQEKLGKSRFKARQISPRGGNVDVEMRGDRVILRGDAVMVMKAEMSF
jgi:PhzF family phenazine biosynthesis protein